MSDEAAIRYAETDAYAEAILFPDYKDKYDLNNRPPVWAEVCQNIFWTSPLTLAQSPGPISWTAWSTSQQSEVGRIAATASSMAFF